MPYNINDYQPFREGRHPVFTSPKNGCKHKSSFPTGKEDSASCTVNLPPCQPFLHG